MKDLSLMIEELEHRVVPSTCILTVDVPLPALPDVAAADPEPFAVVNEAAVVANGAGGVVMVDCEVAAVS